jgi:hypothetical protein
MRDTKDKLSNLTIFLHWVVGLTPPKGGGVATDYVIYIKYIIRPQ